MACTKEQTKSWQFVNINYVTACGRCWYQSYNILNAANTLNYAHILEKVSYKTRKRSESSRFLALSKRILLGLRALG
jgi:hypothetical protein